MIGSLSGHIKAIYAPFILIEVNGVGYEVETPMTTFCQLQQDTNVFLWTHLVVREDAQLLYGFSSQNERALFRTLIKINGVGAKLAIAILSSIDVGRLKQAVDNNHATALTKIPGVGKKTAERLIIELRDKLDAFHIEADNQAEPLDKASSNQTNLLAEQETIAALQSLGYSAKEAEKTVKAVYQDGMSTQHLIRLSLKQLSGN